MNYGWRIRVAKEQTLNAREAIKELDGKEAEPILSELELALIHLRKAEAEAIALTKTLLAERTTP